MRPLRPEARLLRKYRKLAQAAIVLHGLEGSMVRVKYHEARARLLVSIRELEGDTLWRFVDKRVKGGDR